jgi:hypothetical protein
MIPFQNCPPNFEYLSLAKVRKNLLPLLTCRKLSTVLFRLFSIPRTKSIYLSFPSHRPRISQRTSELLFASNKFYCYAECNVGKHVVWPLWTSLLWPLISCSSQLFTSVCRPTDKYSEKNLLQTNYYIYQQARRFCPSICRSLLQMGETYTHRPATSWTFSHWSY